MRKYSGKKLANDVRKFYRSIVSEKRDCTGSYSATKEIFGNGHLIRSCCLNILNVQKEFSECLYSESGLPFILEEAQNFCEISNFVLTEDSITVFSKKLAQRKNLSYAEISCLIPMMEYCCVRFLSEETERSNASLKSVILSLHALNSYDCSRLAENLSKAEDVLKRDTVYPYLDESSKNLYRIKLRKLAKKRGEEERETAVELLKEARKSTEEKKKQIGSHLFRERNNKCYFPVLTIFCFLFSFISYVCLQSITLFFLSLIPIIISAKLLCDTIFSRIIKPKLLPKIKIKRENCPISMLTIVSMVSNQTDGEKLLHRLEVLAHRIPIESIRIGLLLDLPASKEELSEKDRELISFLESGIYKMNKESDRFFCAIRSRKWVAEKYHFEAFGRKQGAMMEFCDLISGDGSSFSLAVGRFDHAKYLITLDADTEPTPDAVESLIGFMEHPNHAPELATDPKGFSYVRSGYGAAAPRVEANPETSYNTPYSAMMSGNSGTEFYKNPHFNLYQDLFSEGIFCGKGILRIDLYKTLIADRFRKDPILSHDLPEGEFLRCANLSDIVFFDEIPGSVLSDEKRTHRWIRGDFQNGIFLFPGKNNSNLFRFKILHNMLRALFPFACFWLIASTIFIGIKGFLLGLFWISFPFLLRLPVLFSASLGKVRRHYPYREFFDAFKEMLLNILLLPSRAINGIDAAIRGTIRQIRGKNKLEWTTAASASASGKEISDFFYQLRWQLTGFFFLFFPKTVLIGALWLVAPVIARQISLPYSKDHVNSEELQEELKPMWQYYADLMNEKSHWLPPDNYQQEPLNIVAPRTSPTNIGLAMISVLGAYDLDFISEDELYFRLENTLDTLESLPKWKGHLYNWYDTQTLKVLPPKFISTVDCGNYATCLYTLAKGMESLKTDRSNTIIKRISVLLDETDFSVLYDEKKKLFPIGYNVEEDRMSSSYYDLYASEARLTSYYAIMKHQISPEHWVRLARPTGNSQGSLILSSWSGTMFEYFMPHLFLPAYRRTLSGEALRGIVTAQMKYADKRIPWGISESCYYNFDSLLNYQYRAFGIPAAALRRDLSFPFVISPYSTFLAYPWFPSFAEKNKKLLPKGKYGYYEAIDYRSGIDNPRVVQSYMAHHVGMSFLSGVNILKNHVMQKRFMRGEGEAYSSLLTEGIPAYSKNYFPDHTKDRERWESAQVRIDRPDPEHPKVRLLTNGKLTEILTDSGTGVLREKDRDITKYSADPQSPNGIFILVKNKGKLYGTTYAPLYQEGSYRMYFDGAGASCYGSFSDFETRMTVTMVPDQPVSVRELTIKNNQMTENSFEFFLLTEPVLCNRREYRAHPEYKDLFLTAEYDPSVRTISFYRKSEELWFSVTASEPFRFDVCRDHFRDVSDVAVGKTEGISPYPIFPGLTLRGVLDVRGRGTGSVRFFFSVGKTKQESIDRIRSIVSHNFETLQRRYSQFFDSLCHSTNIRSADRLIFDQIAPQILMPALKNSTKEKAGNTLPLKTLWKFGISGDYPILTVRIGKDGIARILPFVKSVFLMTYAGIPMDLILLYREEEAYQTPIKTALESVLSEIEDSVRARIFPLNIQTIDEYLFIQKCSCLFINLERGWKLRNPNRTFRPIRVDGTPISTEKLQLPLGRGGFGKNQSYIIPKSEKGFLRPWSIVLANEKFGTVLTERSLGYTFSENASENRITPRIPGNGYSFSGERYYAVIRGKRYDLLRNAAVEFRTDRVIYCIDLLGYKITTEVIVSKKFPAKIITVTVDTNLTIMPEIVYEPQIILGQEQRGTVTRYTEDQKIFFTNAANGHYGNGHAVLFGIGVTLDGNSLHFRPDNELKSGTFVLAYGSGPRSSGKIARILSEPNRIKKELKKSATAERCYIKIETPDKEFNAFCNGFLVHQILASRILGRTGSCQPGGAYGFRDQLQDSLCLATYQSAYLKRQILRCCSHQFEEGDVLHWWHPRRNRNDDGIRTRFSDDPFWLAYACGEYFKITENLSFFQKTVPYLKASPLNDSEVDRYFTPERSEKRESIYSHGLRAIRYGMKTGQHGLILFGSGDWNDGMNRIETGGETVWGSMFALLSIEKFRSAAEVIGRKEEIAELIEYSESLRTALNDHSFSNGRFLRGYRKDGTPFGGEDTIELIPQAFSVFCELNKENINDALTLAYQKLWDPQRRLIKLLTPPYQPQEDGFPGSIAAYPPGVRENGGQYTHAGIWFARALLQAGNVDQGWEILSGINPVNHTKTPADVNSYGAEPYVLAADVYTLPGRDGFAGWTHYTGAAGWYLKTVTEDLLGIHRQGRRITIQPNLPKEWNGYRGEFRIEKDLFKIRVERGTEIGCFENGSKVKFIPLNETEHDVSVIVP